MFPSIKILLHGSRKKNYYRTWAPLWEGGEKTAREINIFRLNTKLCTQCKCGDGRIRSFCALVAKLCEFHI